MIRFALLVIFAGCVNCLIIPEELPTILSLIYSNIPPIKKGTDSRVGVGFRLGEHADFQILVELGPQRETEPIGNTDAKRRRQATLNAAMRGDLGPWAQSVAKYQTQLRIQKELEEMARLEEKLKRAVSVKKPIDSQSEGSEWLKNWSQGMVEPPGEEPVPERLPIQEILPITSQDRVLPNRVIPGVGNANTKMEQLRKLYKPQPVAQSVV